MITRKQTFWRLGTVLLLYAALNLAHNVLLPLGNAPDEIDHFRYTQFIARNGRLPLNDAEREQAGNKAYLPAFYHGLTALLTGWSATDAPPRLKFIWESPRFDLSRTLFHTEYLVNTEDELAPFQGVVLMWHLGRAVSLLIGLGVIVVTFFTGLQIFSGNYWLALVSASITAFIPAFIFISGAMSYEPLVALLVGLYFLYLVKIVKGDNRLRNYIWLGLLLGLSVTVKYISVILPLQVILVMAYLTWQRRGGWTAWLKPVAIVGVSAVIASSWWFLFLATNFNQIEAHGPVVGLLKPIIAGGTDTTQNYTAYFLTGGQIGRAGNIIRPPFSDWIIQIFQSFWVEKLGYYPLEPGAFLFIGLICGVALAGLIVAWRREPARRFWIMLLLSQLLFFLFFPLMRYLIQGELNHTAQGRHLLFPLATTLPLLMVFGWPGWLSARVQRLLALALVGGLMTWSMAQLVHVAKCCTAPLPVLTSADAAARIPHRLDQPFGDHLVLAGYDTRVDAKAGVLELTLFWQSPTYADEDYQLSVELMQEGEHRLIWQAYPTNGRYATRVWEQWETVRDELAFPLTDLPAGDYQIRLQLLTSRGPLLADGKDHLLLTGLKLPEADPAEPDLPLSVSVDGQMVVRGMTWWQTGPYQKLGRPEFKPRMAIPFIWHGQAWPDLTVKWHLVDDDGQTYPAHQASTHFGYFMVGPNWLPGDYRLRVEVWRAEEVVASEELPSLVTIFNKQPRLVDAPAIPYPREANFADRIKLLGYEVPNETVSPGQGIPITLYWQAQRTMEHNYTFFTKLFDEQQQQWGGLDRFARDGYKTTHWLEQEVVVDQFELPTDPNTPPGVFWLNVGLYLGLNQSTISLPLVVDGQPTGETSLTLGPVKIGGPPPDIVTTDISPEHELDVDLGQVVRLRGYDLAQAEDRLDLTLYWESLARLDADQTVFVHIRNQAGQTIAQMDRPPLDGAYPTSLWEPGEIIPDNLTIPLPATLPPDQYTVVVGMYDFATGARLPIDQSIDNSATLLAMEIR